MVLPGEPLSGAVEVAIVGAGVVGCAIAQRLARVGVRVLLLEAAAREGTRLTERNSGVIHSGLYYRPGSHKARTCVRGQELLYEWAARRGVAHRRCGKLVVARDEPGREALEALYANAREAGAREVRLVDGAEAARLEPGIVPPRAALWCPWTGIVDAPGLARSLRRAAEADGADVACGARVVGIEPRGDGFSVESTLGALEVPRLVNAAGGDADRVAGMLGVTRWTHHPCRGDWFRVRGRPGRFQRLVYPVRRRDERSLGIHLTLDLGGGVRLGPDAEWIDDREDLSPARGERKLARFAEAGRRLLGQLEAADLSWDGAGVRPRLLPAGDGPAFADFVLEEDPPGVLHLIGIESPGMTAAMGLAEVVAARLTG